MGKFRKCISRKGRKRMRRSSMKRSSMKRSRRKSSRRSMRGGVKSRRRRSSRRSRRSRRSMRGGIKVKSEYLDEAAVAKDAGDLEEMIDHINTFTDNYASDDFDQDEEYQAHIETEESIQEKLEDCIMKTKDALARYHEITGLNMPIITDYNTLDAVCAQIRGEAIENQDLNEVVDMLDDAIQDRNAAYDEFDDWNDSEIVMR